jgi:hypothetical protein
MLATRVRPIDVTRRIGAGAMLHRLRWLFFDDDFVGLTRDRSPETLAQIRHDFCRYRRAPNGWWYANRAYGACAGSL